MMTDRSRTGERQNPQSEWRIKRVSLIGSRSADFIRASGSKSPHKQAEHMTAHDPHPSHQSKISLASPGPSTHSLAMTIAAQN